MTPLARALAGLLLGIASAGTALAQLPPGLPNPDLQNRIPAPLPPPPQPPIINGPLGQVAAPGVYLPRRLETFSDRAAGCVQAGAEHGLRGARLDRYTRRCAGQ